MMLRKRLKNKPPKASSKHQQSTQQPSQRSSG